MNYKELSNEDKIAAVLEEGFQSNARGFVDEYLEALKTNDRAAIEEFESFGGYLRQMIENRVHFARACSAFGFTAVAFNEYGWAAREEFLDCETFAFGRGVKGNLMGSNSLTIGRGPNGKWAYCLDLGTANTGMGYCLSVFDAPHASRHACLRNGLEKVVVWHTKNPDPKTAPVLREAKDMLDEVTGRKPKQLTLF